MTSEASLSSLDLPMELRAAIDLVALRCVSRDGEIRGKIVGVDRLVAELHRYARVVPGSDWLICLGAGPDEVAASATASEAGAVLSLVRGPLSRFRGLVAHAPAIDHSLSNDLPEQDWRHLGYERSATKGVQGPGAIGWALAERLARIPGRPDLADRFRIGMLRTLIAARPLTLSTVRLHYYRQVRG